MSFLSKLRAVAISTARLLGAFTRTALWVLGELFKLLFGKLLWHPPIWATPLRRIGKAQFDNARRHPRQVAAGAGVLVLIVAGMRARLFARYAADHADAGVQADQVRAPLALRRGR